MTRRTQVRLAIAAELLRGSERVHWGYELSRNAGVGAGSMYPFLSELLERGCLSDGWEELTKASGRPPRRYYRVTEDGKRFLAEFLNAAPVGQVRQRTAPRPAPKAAES